MQMPQLTRQVEQSA